MGYTKTAIKGFSWLTALRVVARSFSLVKTAIVARFLTPSQFGLFGIAALVLSFIEVVTETGVNVFLVQQKDDINKYLGTALIISIGRGIVISLAIIIVTPFVADFFKSPESSNLLYAMSIVPFLRGFINPAVVRFQKELLFHKEFYFRSINITVEILATIAFLLIFPQPMSLILGIIVGVITEVILSYVFITPRPRLDWNKQYIKKLLHHGKWITTAVIFNYGFERGDNIVVGRMLGTASLGIYEMAYRFSMLPVTEVVDMVTRVVFPVYVRISDDYDRLRRAYFRSIGVVAILTVPFGVVVGIFPEFIVSLVLGDKWLVAAPVLQVLSVLAVIRGISLSFSAILLALNKQKLVTVTTLIGLTGMLVTIVPLINYFGLVGAAYAASLGYMISVPFILFFSLKTLEEVKRST